MVEKIGNYWKDGLSIKETKFSVIMLVFLAYSIYNIFHVYMFGDIPNNVLFFMTGLLTAITGINIAEEIKDVRIEEFKNTERIKDKDIEAKG